MTDAIQTSRVSTLECIKFTSRSLHSYPTAVNPGQCCFVDCSAQPRLNLVLTSSLSREPFYAKRLFRFSAYSTNGNFAKGSGCRYSKICRVLKWGYSQPEDISGTHTDPRKRMCKSKYRSYWKLHDANGETSSERWRPLNSPRLKLSRAPLISTVLNHVHVCVAKLCRLDAARISRRPPLLIMRNDFPRPSSYVNHA